jgi:hypothetical protein
MNPKAVYLVMRELRPTGGCQEKWGPIHLFPVHKIDARQVQIAKTLCGFETLGDQRKFTNYGERSKFSDSGILAPGLRICEKCEKIRFDEPEPRLYCLVFERWGLDSEGRENWIPQPHEYFHATSDDDARTIVAGYFPAHDPVRVVGFSPAIGFQVEKETKDGLILRA